VSYSYTDSIAEPGVTYHHKLEDVELDGTATKGGPEREWVRRIPELCNPT
jgi:hypothetical protein